MELGSDGRYADMLSRSLVRRSAEQVVGEAMISPGGGDVGWAWVKYAAKD